MQKSVMICVVLLSFGANYAIGGQLDSWTVLDYPGASNTYVLGISGSNIVGSYRWPQDVSDIIHGFLYNIESQTWVIVDMPRTDRTTPLGISGSSIVGRYSLIDEPGEYNFVANGAMCSVFSMPWGDNRSYLSGIDADNYLGFYIDPTGTHGVFYDGADWITFDPPGARYTYPSGISGDNVVGKYYDAYNNKYGFLYNLTTSVCTILAMPGAWETNPAGISGDNVVGCYYQYGTGQHGFFYNIESQTWATIDLPGTSTTYLSGIDGDNIVGSYTGVDGASHGFIYTTPEPATLFLLGLSGLALFRRHKSRG